MRSDVPVYSAAEVILFLCASRCGRDLLSKILVALTVVAAAAAGLVRLLAG